MKNNGYWGTKYKDVLSGAIILSVISIMLSVIIAVFKNHTINPQSYTAYIFMNLLIAVYLIVNYSINYYLLIKRYGFKGSIKKFLFGFIPCITSIAATILTVVK